MDDFKKIYVRYVKEVYYFLLRLCGSDDLAEELTQATFVTAFEKLDQFQGYCKLSVWLCQIAKYKYYEHYRRQKRFSNQDEMNNMPHPGCMEEEVMDVVDQLEILRTLHVIPEPYKEVFTLKVMGEVSYKDISQLFGKSESWARVTYYRAKAMIVDRMRGASNDEM